jgi:hypothetical protein
LYIWRIGDDVGDLDALGRRYKILMLPNFVLPQIADRPIFDLAINKNSFQEMTEDQVRFYGDFLGRSTRGWLYSYNASRQFMNNQLQRSVDSVLADFFVGGPGDEHYSHQHVTFEDPEAKRIFVGYSRMLAKEPPREKRSNTVFLSERSIQL